MLNLWLFKKSQNPPKKTGNKGEKNTFWPILVSLFKGNPPNEPGNAPPPKRHQRLLRPRLLGRGLHGASAAPPRDPADEAPAASR